MNETNQGIDPAEFKDHLDRAREKYQAIHGHEPPKVVDKADEDEYVVKKGRPFQGKKPLPAQSRPRGNKQTALQARKERAEFWKQLGEFRDAAKADNAGKKPDFKTVQKLVSEKKISIPDYLLAAQNSKGVFSQVNAVKLRDKMAYDSASRYIHQVTGVDITKLPMAQQMNYLEELWADDIDDNLNDAVSVIMGLQPQDFVPYPGYPNYQQYQVVKPTRRSLYQQANNLPPRIMQRVTYKPDEPTVHLPANRYSYDAISPKYIACFLSPMDFVERRPTQQPLRTAIATGSFQYTITSNAAGTVGVQLFPRNILTNGVSPNVAFINQFNDATFNPATGIQTPNPVSYPGPLNGSTGAIEQYLMSTMQVEFLATPSVLNQ